MPTGWVATHPYGGWCKYCKEGRHGLCTPEYSEKQPECQCPLRRMDAHP